MLRRTNDLRVVRHGNLAGRFTYSRSATSDPVSDPLFGGAQRVSPFGITYSRSATSDPVSGHSSGVTQWARSRKSLEGLTSRSLMSWEIRVNIDPTSVLMKYHQPHEIYCNFIVVICNWYRCLLDGSSIMHATAAYVISIRQRLLEPNRHFPTYCFQDDVDDLLGVGLSDPCFTTFTRPMIMSSVTLLVQIKLDPPWYNPPWLLNRNMTIIKLCLQTIHASVKVMNVWFCTFNHALHPFIMPIVATSW